MCGVELSRCSIQDSKVSLNVFRQEDNEGLPMFARLLGALLLMAIVGCAPNAIHRSSAVFADSKSPLTPERLEAEEQGCRWDGNSYTTVEAVKSGTPDRPERSGNLYLTSALGSNGKPCRTHSIERSAKYTLFFVEFDEQGRMYDDRQFTQLFSYLEARVACHAGLSIVTFVHGWRHNAAYDDENVALARDVLQFTYQGEAAGEHPNKYRNTESVDRRHRGRCPGPLETLDKPREVVGIYVGWRGKSLDGGQGVLKNWELPSVFDRKNTAESVAVGSVRELFSRLRVFQYRANGDENKCADGAWPYQCKGVRLLIVGHSFGGLLVFNAVSASIMDSINSGAGIDVGNPDNCREGPEPLDPSNRPESKEAAGKSDDPPDSALIRSFADLIVLVNPAIEGVRFEPLHQALRRRGDQLCPNQKPVLIVVTAQNDIATHYAFRIVRAVTTLFEDDRPLGVDQPDAGEMLADRSEQESQSSLNAMGHVQRFQTHGMFDVSELLNQSGPVQTQVQQYCSTPGDSGLESALKACRCGAQRWTDYLTRSPNQNCPAYVEEVNAAQNMGRGLAWLQQQPAPSGTLYASTGWKQAFCGGPVLSHVPLFPSTPSPPDRSKSWSYTEHAPNSPIWMVKSYDKSIINNHSDINQPPFKYFVRQVYHDISIRQFDARAFQDLRAVAESHFDKSGCNAVSEGSTVAEGTAQ